MINIPITTMTDAEQGKLERDIDLIEMAGLVYRVPIAVGPCYPHQVKIVHIGRWREFQDPLEAVAYVRGMA